jgi:hypothetical protein
MTKRQGDKHMMIRAQVVITNKDDGTILSHGSAQVAESSLDYGGGGGSHSAVIEGIPVTIAITIERVEAAPPPEAMK